jgi:outer membrane protein assembly factor BamB
LLGGDLLIWPAGNDDVLAVDPKNGEIVWSFKTGGPVKSKPAIDAERELVAFGSFDTSIYVLDVRTGTQRAAWETGDICHTTPLLLNGKLFCGSADRKLYFADIDRMELIETLAADSRIFASPRAIGTRVLFGRTSGKLIEINSDTLETKGVLQFPDAITNAIAATDDGRTIFVSTYMNDLWAYQRC